MSDISGLVEKQRGYFMSGATRELAFRRNQLLCLRKALQKHEAPLLSALKTDLGKAPFEAYETEIGMVQEEITFLLRHLRGFAGPARVKTPLTHFPSSSRVYQEPYGVALILSPWNYPVQLTLAPLAGAIAAGNCAVVKPSNQSPHVSQAMAELLADVFEERYIGVVHGGREANRSLLEQRFDVIFFTGSVQVGKTVMEAAARHLTPVTLELGGKSPCLVDKTANLALAARRIVWGKCLNAGQTCVAPDYVLVHQSVRDALVKEMAVCVRAFYGSEPLKNEDYPKIISQKHFDRLCGLTEGETVAFGGGWDAQACKIEPTVLCPVSWDAPVMQQEIFGPLLPVLTFETLDEAVGRINARPKPLAFYYFTGSKKDARHVMQRVPCGGGCVNDTVVHLATPFLPFGGVGESGMGSYHGRASFAAFSHSKGVLTKSSLLDIPLRYPPYTHGIGLLKKLLR